MDCLQCRDRAVVLDLGMALVLALFKLTLGTLSGSVALQAHSLHSFGDFLTKGINLASVKISSRQPTPRFPYGYGKAQFLSACLIGLSLLTGAMLMLWHNINHLNMGHLQTPEIWAVFAAMISAVTAELMHRYLCCVAQHTHSPAIMAAAADNRGDAYSSLAVLAGIVLSILGLTSADHFAALFVSLLVMRIGFYITKDSVRGLMDSNVSSHQMNSIRHVLKAAHPEIEILALRGRWIGEVCEIDLQLSVSGEFTVHECEALSGELETLIAQAHAHARHILIRFVHQDEEILESTFAV